MGAYADGKSSFSFSTRLCDFAESRGVKEVEGKNHGYCAVDPHPNPLPMVEGTTRSALPNDITRDAPCGDFVLVTRACFFC